VTAWRQTGVWLPCGGDEPGVTWWKLLEARQRRRLALIPPTTFKRFLVERSECGRDLLRARGRTVGPGPRAGWCYRAGRGEMPAATRHPSQEEQRSIPGRRCSAPVIGRLDGAALAGVTAGAAGRCRRCASRRWACRRCCCGRCLPGVKGDRWGAGRSVTGRWHGRSCRRPCLSRGSVAETSTGTFTGPDDELWCSPCRRCCLRCTRARGVAAKSAGAFPQTVTGSSRPWATAR